MKTRSYQELYKYLFGNHADVDQSIENVPDQYKEMRKAIKIEKVKQFFFAEDEPLIVSDAREQFRAVLRNIKAEKLEEILYGNTTDEMDEYPAFYTYFPLENALADGFQKNEDAHHFFGDAPEQSTLDKYKAYCFICKFVREYIEKEDADDADLDYARAYKMLVLFSDVFAEKKEFKAQSAVNEYFKYFDAFVKSHNLFEKPHPLHDTFLWSLPKYEVGEEVRNLVEWQRIIFASGRRAIRLFSKAREIEAKLGRAPANFLEAFETGKTIIYKNMAANREFADLCMYYDVPEQIFDRCLELQKNRKVSDKLPDVVIDGAEVNHPGYFLVKLPIEDPRAFILGQLTDCCQFIGGHSETCVIDGITREHNGFYVLLKQKKPRVALEVKTASHAAKTTPMIKVEGEEAKINYQEFEIIGQGYAWLSTTGNLTFDSWENLRISENPVSIKLLQQFAKTIVNQTGSTIFRFTIGEGGKTPEEFEEEVGLPETMQEGYQYGDSKNQKLIYAHAEHQAEMLASYFKIYRQLFSEMIPDDDELKESNTAAILQDYISSYDQLARIKALSENEEVIAYLHQKEIILNCQKKLEKPRSYSRSCPVSNARRYAKLEIAFFIMEILSVLNQADICTPDKVDIVFGFDHIIDNLESIIKLYSAGLLSEKNFKSINDSCHMHEMVDTLIALDKEESESPGYEYGHAMKYAIQDGKIDFIRMLINSKRIDLNDILTRHDGLTPLATAVSGHDLMMVTFLLENGAKSYAKVYFQAAQFSMSAIVELLIAHGVTIDECDPWTGKTALHFAIAGGSNYCSNVDVIRFLLAKGANLEIINHAGNTPLFSLFNGHAIYNKNFSETLKVLLEAKTDVNAVDQNGYPLLLRAILCRVITPDQENPIGLILKREDLQIDSEILLDSERYRFIEDAKQRAVAQSYGAMLVTLYEAKLINNENADRIGSKLTFFDDLGEAVKTLVEAKLLNAESLHILLSGFYGTKFTRKTNTSVAKLLVSLEHGGDFVDNYYTAELLSVLACDQKNDLLVKKLFQTQKININAMSSRGELLLVTALASSCNPSIINILLDAKADPTLKEVGGDTAIHAAATNNRPEIAARLVSLNADVNAVAKGAITPLHVATRHNRAALVEFLINAKANVFAKDDEGLMALHMAMRLRYYPLAKTLVELKADVNSVTEECGCTALHYIVQERDDTQMTKFLLDAKADINIKNKGGKTPLQSVSKIFDPAKYAMLQLKEITADDLSWLKSQVIKLEIIDSKLAKILKSLFINENTDAVKFCEALAFLQKLYVAIRAESAPAGCITLNFWEISASKVNADIVNELYAFLLKIEKIYCRGSLDLTEPRANKEIMREPSFGRLGLS